MFAFGIMNNENMTGIFDGMERCSHTDKKKRQDRNISEEIKSNFVLVTVFGMIQVNYVNVLFYGKNDKF